MRERYPHWETIETRWRDNDVYGHVNNVVHYELFDTVINRYLISAGGLDIAEGDVIGVAASSSCEYRAALAFPEPVEAGLVVTELGTSSVHYEIGLFNAGEKTPAAVGTFVHVFVDRTRRRPSPMPTPVRDALRLLHSAADEAEPS
jgi:acyl-CoA thioester hydrolase